MNFVLTGDNNKLSRPAIPVGNPSATQIPVRPRTGVPSVVSSNSLPVRIPAIEYIPPQGANNLPARIINAETANVSNKTGLLSKAGNLVKRSAAPIATALTVKEVSDYLSEKQRATGQDTATALAQQVRPTSSWSAPTSTMGISSTNPYTGDVVKKTNPMFNFKNKYEYSDHWNDNFNQDVAENMRNNWIMKEMAPDVPAVPAINTGEEKSAGFIDNRVVPKEDFRALKALNDVVSSGRQDINGAYDQGNSNWRNIISEVQGMQQPTSSAGAQAVIQLLTGGASAMMDSGAKRASALGDLTKTNVQATSEGWKQATEEPRRFEFERFKEGSPLTMAQIRNQDASAEQNKLAGRLAAVKAKMASLGTNTEDDSVLQTVKALTELSKTNQEVIKPADILTFIKQNQNRMGSRSYKTNPAALD